MLLSATLVCLLPAISQGPAWSWGSARVIGPFALLAWAHGALWEVYAACAVIGVGYGLAFAVLAVIAVAALGVAAAIPRGPGGARDPREDRGVDSGNVQVRALE
ncbi:hypothetical protein [Actinomadura nitritigenes]|uniref:hypothetical protein n=1 Tax=Actinomadura nitritigenes TaxID=134602 RepID=UPI003D8CD082